MHNRESSGKYAREEVKIVSGNWVLILSCRSDEEEKEEKIDLYGGFGNRIK